MPLDTLSHIPGRMQLASEWQEAKDTALKLLQQVPVGKPFFFISLDPDGAKIEGFGGTEDKFVAIGMICEMLYRMGVLPAPAFRYRNLMADLSEKAEKAEEPETERAKDGQAR